MGLWLLLGVAVGHAATITVNTDDDELNADGDCSLREAVRAANLDLAVDGCVAGSGADTIVIPAGDYALGIAGSAEDAALTGDLDLTESVSLVGAGPLATMVGAGVLDRVVDVVGSITVHLANLTIHNGTAPSGEGGGGLRVGVGATVSLTDCVVQANTAQEGGGISAAYATLSLLRTTLWINTSTGAAGGLYAFVTETQITDSTIADNTAGNGGGGIVVGGLSTLFTVALTGTTVSGNAGTNGGGMFVGNAAQVTVRNSTFSGNTASGNGGAIIQSFGEGVTLANVTVAGNTANNGGGVYESGTSSAPITLRNTILADNTATSGSSPDCSGTIVSEGYNLIESVLGCTVTLATSDLSGVDPGLLALADNGGPTQTRALGTGSPARDAANPATPGSGGTACEATDQRGYGRPEGSACDIGALEQDATPATTTTTTTTTTTSTTTTTTVATTTTTSSTTTSSVAPTTTTSTSTLPASSTTSTTLPPLCAQPVALTGLRLKLGKAGDPLGDEKVLLRGTLGFPNGAPATFDPATTGVQIVIEDLLPSGPVALWNFSGATAPIPPGAPGTGCGAKDGWKKTTYRNTSGALPPTCASGSAAGLRQLVLGDRRAKGKGIAFTAKGQGGRFLSPRAALRVTVVLGADAAAGASDACAVGELASGACEMKGKKVSCD